VNSLVSASLGVHLAKGIQKKGEGRPGRRGGIKIVRDRGPPVRTKTLAEMTSHHEPGEQI